uniref:FZ domain-containing protein n=1 Tax=Cryptomonas curvata TaxID=233186 RepID=A0A7S0LV16_9CRYP
MKAPSLILQCTSLVILCEIVGATNFCMQNCSKPLFNTFCKIDEDVCAYPTGDSDALSAFRAMAVWAGTSENDCLRQFSIFICSMYFPKCRFRTVIPVCWESCYKTYKTCATRNADAVATRRCSAFVSTGQVSASTCQNGVDSATGAACACFSGSPRISPSSQIWALALSLLTALLSSKTLR